jgi:SprT-like family.
MGDDGPKDLGGVILPSANTAAGTFSVDAQGEVEIRFSRDLMDHPGDLIATFAHELAHLLLHARGVEEGVSAEDAELVTDLAAVYLGFGVFLANSAFELQQFDDGLMGGWSSRRQGYLTENTLVYATALFCAIKDDGFDEARGALKPRLQSVFDRALKQIGRRGDQWGLFDLDRNPAS